MGIEEFLLDRAKKEGREEECKKAKEELEKAKEEFVDISNRENALKMKQNGIALNLISNITGLSIEEIEKIS